MPAIDFSNLVEDDKFLVDLSLGVWLMDNHRWALKVWETERQRTRYTLSHAGFHCDACYDFHDEAEKEAPLPNASSEQIDPCQFMPTMGILIPNMGMQPISRSKDASLADALFSGTRQRVLALTFGQPARSFYATELIGLAGSGSGSVQRELARLAQSGLVTVRAVGNQKHYRANPESPIYAELCGLVQKTFGLAEPLRRALAQLAPQIRAAFVYGSVAKQTDTSTSDIDLMLLSDQLSYADTFAALETASGTLGRTVNPTILTRPEFTKRLKANESFLTRVLAQPKVWLIGGENDLAV